MFETTVNAIEVVSASAFGFYLAHNGFSADTVGFTVAKEPEGVAKEPEDVKYVANLVAEDEVISKRRKVEDKLRRLQNNDIGRGRIKNTGR